MEETWVFACPLACPTGALHTLYKRLADFLAIPLKIQRCREPYVISIVIFRLYQRNATEYHNFMVTPPGSCNSVSMHNLNNCAVIHSGAQPAKIRIAHCVSTLLRDDQEVTKSRQPKCIVKKKKNYWLITACCIASCGKYFRRLCVSSQLQAEPP